MTPDPQKRLTAVTLDDKTIERSTPDREHERAIAIFDLVERNSFAPAGHEGGPYALQLSMAEGRLLFDIRTETGEPVCTESLSITPLRKILRDYFMMCDTYYAAIRTHTPAQIEAIDLGRRGLHNEAAQMLLDHFENRISLDFQTARQLFTLLAALLAKG